MFSISIWHLDVVLGPGKIRFLYFTAELGLLGLATLRSYEDAHGISFVDPRLC